MKKITMFILMWFTMLLVNTSCKKKIAEKSIAEKLQHKWTVVDVNENFHYSGADHFINTIAATGDYIDFRTNGEAYTREQGYLDTSVYSLVSDTKLVLIDTLTIQALTDNTLKLYNKRATNSTIYTEATINCTR